MSPISTITCTAAVSCRAMYTTLDKAMGAGILRKGRVVQQPSHKNKPSHIWQIPKQVRARSKLGKVSDRDWPPRVASAPLSLWYERPPP